MKKLYVTVSDDVYEKLSYYVSTLSKMDAGVGVSKSLVVNSILLDELDRSASKSPHLWKKFFSSRSCSE